MTPRNDSSPHHDRITMSNVSLDTHSSEAPRSPSQTNPHDRRTVSVFSGALSGAVVSACIQPLDVIRTRMQADAACGTILSTPQAARTILKERGLLGLWRGTQPTVVRLGIGAGLHFFFLESLKPLFERRDEHGTSTLGPLGAALTGGLSRALAAVVSCPITVVKTRMEYSGVVAAVPQYKNLVHALGTIAKEEGVRGLYRGLGPTMFSNAPFSALYYLFYTRLREKLKSTPEPSTVVNFASGAIAAVAATLITQPADVVRTRVQLNLTSSFPGGGVKGVVNGARSSRNSLSVLQQVTSSQGAKGLLVGAAPRVMKRTMQTALVWTLYEELVPLLQQLASRLQADVGTRSD